MIDVLFKTTDISTSKQLKALEALKSKEELLGDIISLLQSPAQNVLSGLQSAGGSIAGMLKTLEERA